MQLRMNAAGGPVYRGGGCELHVDMVATTTVAARTPTETQHPHCGGGGEVS
jgi:hypothetical protein